MFFRQVLYRDLGCASYLLGDAGEAVVVDPRWDIEVYLEIARAERLRIAHILDTHDHADHVSGRERLAAATGACVHRSGSATGLASGENLRVGALELRALATPGHRPEHTSFTVADLSRGTDPWLVLTGDSLLVGDIARPDLAYEAADGARALYATLRQLLELGDHVEIWPAHIGGSLCGGAGLSGKTSSTVGFERRHNPLLTMRQPDFVSTLIADLPSRPPNIDRVVSLNRRSGMRPPASFPLLSARQLRNLLADGTTVLDARAPDQFDLGHLTGSVNLPVSSAGAGTRAGWALDADEPLVIVASDADQAHAMALAVQAVGFQTLAGWSEADPSSWSEGGLSVAEAAAWDLDRLASELLDGWAYLLDVREPREWSAGHVPGSVNVPLRQLRDISSVPAVGAGRTTAVACAGGVRAAFAASLLRRAGRADVVRVAGGGISDLQSRGVSLELGLEALLATS
jgi:hydroxyacylglutathione hydrolase